MINKIDDNTHTTTTTIEDASRGTAATLSFRLNCWDWLWCHQQIVSVKIGHHWCRQTGFVCLASSECPTTVKWISMSARLTEWSAEWLTQLLLTNGDASGRDNYVRNDWPEQLLKRMKAITCAVHLFLLNHVFGIFLLRHMRPTTISFELVLLNYFFCDTCDLQLFLFNYFFSRARTRTIRTCFRISIWM